MAFVMWIQDHCGGRWLDQSNPGPDVGGTDVGRGQLENSEDGGFTLW